MIKRPFKLIGCLLLLIILLSACCADIRSPASVIPEPLFEAQTPQNVGKLANVFPEEFLNQLNAEKITLTEKFLSIEITPSDFVRVEIELLKSEDDSASRYLEECSDTHSYQYPEKFTYAGSPGNQYCISYVKQARLGQDSLCEPYEKYYTKAVFQKGQIIIIFRESSLHIDNEQMNRAIETFADQLNKYGKNIDY
jgi:hypothetical protein